MEIFRRIRFFHTLQRSTKVSNLRRVLRIKQSIHGEIAAEELNISLDPMYEKYVG